MGFFSWKTQDTNRSIANAYSRRKTFKVYMVNPKTKEFWVEENYEGYGVFGSKDFYELLAEMNGKKTRSEGIALAFSDNEHVSPILVEDLNSWTSFIGQKPSFCENQGYFYN